MSLGGDHPINKVPYQILVDPVLSKLGGSNERLLRTGLPFFRFLLDSLDLVVETVEPSLAQRPPFLRQTHTYIGQRPLNRDPVKLLLIAVLLIGWSAPRDPLSSPYSS